MENVNVKMILINEEGKIFLLHRDDIPEISVPNKWSFVGGALEENESYEEGALRETKEEIGYDVNDYELFRIYEDSGIKRVIFVGKIDKKIEELELTKGDDMGFFSVEEALKMDISGNTRRYILDYFRH